MIERLSAIWTRARALARVGRLLAYRPPVAVGVHWEVHPADRPWLVVYLSRGLGCEPVDASLDRPWREVRARLDVAAGLVFDERWRSNPWEGATFARDEEDGHEFE